MTFGAHTAAVLLLKRSFLKLLGCPRWGQNGGAAGTWGSGLLSTAEAGGEAPGEGHPAGGVWSGLYCLCDW